MRAIARDAAYIEARSIPEPNSGCWIWTRDIARDGYGKMVMGGVNMSASRASYIIHKGEIADGLQVDHICHQPACVNPDHLRAVTPSFNRRYCKPNNGGQPDPTKCRNGHPFEAPVLRDQTGARWNCRECNRAAARRYKARVRLACTAADAPAR